MNSKKIDDEQPRSWLERISHVFQQPPDSKTDILRLLKAATNQKVLDEESLSMIEGVLNVSSLQVRDIMIPRAQMIVVKKGQSPQEFLPLIVEASHSRFPVIDDDKDDVIGILLAKDLLKYFIENPGEQATLTENLLRPAIFVPESKRLDILLKEFRSSHNHLAIVVDEYGSVSGVVTIEDVLEEIVGDIEDEFDAEEDAFIQKLDNGKYKVSALTEIEEFNDYFNCQLSSEHVDTMGGLVMQTLGYVPTTGESINSKPFKIEVLEADDRRVYQLLVSEHVTDHDT